jgi:hypothetical protein
MHSRLYSPEAAPASRGRRSLVSLADQMPIARKDLVNLVKREIGQTDLENTQEELVNS